MAGGADWKSCCPLRDLLSPDEADPSSGIISPDQNLQSSVERLTTETQGSQKPCGLSESQHLSHPVAVTTVSTS